LDGVQLARELSHPFTLAWVLNGATYIRMARGDESESSALCDENVILCARYGFDALLQSAMVWQGYAMARRGNAEGIARIREGLAITKGSWRTDGLGLLAEAHLLLGQGEEGLSAVTEALVSESNSDRRSIIAWLGRLKGDLLLAQNDRNKPEAERLFRESREIAQKQNNKSEELETTLALSRLIARRNRDDARAMLAGIYNWFTEGLDTTALKEAKTLLDELSRTSAISRRRRRA
jgi:predicted ATPase